MPDHEEEQPKKKKRRRGNTLETWEIAIVKAMIARGGNFSNDQDILAYFTRPTRSVNHRLIAEIRTETKHKAIKTAPETDLDTFLSIWPDIDHETGLSVRGDELLIKAREAMIAAVQTFNGAGLTFRAELFIVTAIIAWTYLMHAWFKREGIDYTYTGQTTKAGEDKYWDLGHCLKQGKCPAKGGVAKNLEFLIEIRHEIEHRTTSRIDDALGAKLQSCALNFNDLLKKEFGLQYGLEKRLPIALQFVSFETEQISALKKASGLPKSIETTIDAFEQGLTEEQLKDPAYRMSYGFVPMTAKKPGAADAAVSIVATGSDEADEIEKIILKEVNKTRYPPGKVVAKVQAAGFPNFRMQDHIELWQSLDGKNPAKGYGCQGDYNGTWVWFDRWFYRVIEHCEQEGGKYR
ncbi:Protein of unknown function [Pseudooceanicola nitratireducens]|uniref:DUF3644 domain-containing protein n=1 Tax=Pseudooceanicola nitratireducens TaxID=517719 RepID=A0A1I1MDU4_9RHOB|nr:DUF3644 domain-containing protein [Pseudooceanicola nitratireducens]SEI87599.1 Protein of unknown function [Pseudooceanicola nitratireducens]SFC83631.1 Protein of unknown function [Pseudooceanicola nitratireducens]